MSLIAIKVIIAVMFVVTLSVVAERVGPRIAGILGGYPAGTAITLFFFGFEVSPEFAARSALYNVLGMVALQTFLYCYYRAAAWATRLTIVVASLCGILGFLAATWGLHLVHLPLWLHVIAPIASIGVFAALFRRIENHGIARKGRFGFHILVLRAVFSAMIILGVTGVAKIVGPTWAGLFSAFPTTVFPLILIVHYTHGTPAVLTLIKHIPFGLGAVITYSFTVSLVYPRVGIYLGTLLGFMAATVYLLIYMRYTFRTR